MTATELTAQTLSTKTILKLIAKTLVAFVKEVSLLELRGKTSYGRMMSMLSQFGCDGDKNSLGLHGV